MNMRLLCLLLLVSAAWSADLFSSVHELEAADRDEKTLMQALGTVVHQMKNKIKPLAEAYLEISAARGPGMSRAEYLGDPVNTFSLIRRLVKQWPLLLQLMAEVSDVEHLVQMLPAVEEYERALRGMARLQEVYSLDLNQLTGVENNLMTAGDCLNMGQHLSQRGYYTQASMWLEQALHLVSQGDSTVVRSQVLPLLYVASAFSAGCEGAEMTTSPLDLLHQLLTDPVAAEIMFSSADLSLQFHQILQDNCSFAEDRRRQLLVGSHMQDDTARLYNTMCSGSSSPPDPQSQRTLRCYLVSHDNPRLLLAPFKLEELHIYPPIYLFHDVISDQEIHEMKEASSKQMSECGTLYENTEQKNFYRTCHVGWVRDEDSFTAAALTRRAADMTALDMTYSEHNQVAMYGLGGEFQLHQDPLPNKTLSSEDYEGNRIATLMFYMSEVEEGGRTIFPYINQAVSPLKGSAIFWFNLNQEGRMLNEVWHGGCPVLKGNKWVLNKWIHEGSQDSVITCPRELSFPHSYYLQTRRNIT